MLERTANQTRAKVPVLPGQNCTAGATRDRALGTAGAPPASPVFLVCATAQGQEQLVGLCWLAKHGPNSHLPGSPGGDLSGKRLFAMSLLRMR